jgi:uncharacterized protein (TIGR02757 family)
MSPDELKKKLEFFYKKYHNPAFINTDPIQCVHHFYSSQDREIAGLVASALAYGRAEIIIRNCEWVFEKTGLQIAKFVAETDYSEKKKVFKGFKHRFNDHIDLSALMECISVILKEYGSIGNLFSESANSSIKESLTHFTRFFKEQGKIIIGSRKKSYEYLFPSPESGSACKRMNMYLRWMVRHDDSIDFGIWKNISPSNLIIPVDTHIASIAVALGLTLRRSADWQMAEQITSALRRIDPSDPVRFDFSLCRVGMIDFRRAAA